MAHEDESLQRQAKGVLREDSDRLLKAVDELRALERQKRSLEISSEPFHDLARRVEEKAREVFRLAEEQQQDGEVVDKLEEAEPGPDNAGSIDDAMGTPTLTRGRDPDDGTGGW
jgi:signal transduction histidine kinase